MDKKGEQFIVQVVRISMYR